MALTFTLLEILMDLRPLLALGAGVALATGVAAQDVDSKQQSLIDKRDKKLGSEFLKKAEWFTDYDKARAAAKQSKKLMFGYFTRSYSP